MRHRLLSLALLLLVSAGTASTQDTALIDRILQVEDARDDGPAADPALRAGLQAADPATRALAARAAGRLERAGRLSLLAPALDDADARVRRDAAWAIAQIARTADDARASQRALLARLRAETDPAVQGELAASLGRLPLAAPDDLAATDAALTALLPGGVSAPGAGVAGRASGAPGRTPAARAAAPSPAPDPLTGAVQGLESRSRLTRATAPLPPDTLARLRAVTHLRPAAVAGTASASGSAPASPVARQPGTPASTTAAASPARPAPPGATTSAGAGRTAAPAPLAPLRAPDPAPAAPDPLARARRLALAALVQSAAVDTALVRDALGDDDAEVRRLAMVGASGDVMLDERTALLRRGLSDADASVRYEALRGWGRYLQTADCAPVVAAARGGGGPHLALLGIDLLGAGCQGEAAAEARTLLTTAITGLPMALGPAAWQRGAHALVALARLAPAAARPAVATAAAHPVWQVRMYAARAAGRLDARATLVRLGRDTSDNVRHAALEALLAAKAPEAAALGVEALGRGDYQLLQAAARAAATDTDRTRATRALLAALARVSGAGRDTARDPRVALVEAVARTAGPDDVAALRPYAADADPVVASAARAAIAGIESGTTAPAGAAASDTTTRVEGDDASVRRIPPRTSPPPREADIAALDGARLRLTMARGGVVEIALDARMAPASVLRVAALARRGYYDGLTFHRVVPGFVVQGGSPGANEYMGDTTYMRDEPRLPHLRGAVGISTRGRDTGDAQLFIDLVDVPRLDHTYTVIGQVVSGLAVVDGILEGDVFRRVEVVLPAR